MSTPTNMPVEPSRSAKSSRHGARSRRSDEAVSRLVRRAAQGDQRAWNELVDEFSGIVWSVARAYGLNDADAADVSQITWQRLVEHLHRLRDPARVGAWLATTARRQCTQIHREAHPIPVGDQLPEQDSQALAPDAAMLTNERDITLWNALADLPVRDRRLLRMLMTDPAPSYAEIGAALGMPIGSIGPTRARALERLRRAACRRGLDDPEW